jgi:hypothetical protein
MKEFDLSKNIHKVDLDYLDEDDNNFATYEAIEVSKIKEFIRLLKERNCMFSDLSVICKTCGNEKRYFMRDASMCFDCYIDKLAGKKLK